MHRPFPEAIKFERNRSFLHDTGKYLCSPVTSPPYWAAEQIYPDNFNYNGTFCKQQRSFTPNSKNYPEHDNYGFDSTFVPIEYGYNEQYNFENGGSYPQDINTYHLTNSIPEDSVSNSTRPRALSFSDTRVEVPKKSGKSIRDRNLRRQSYNPQTYESSSSDSECTSLGSAVHSDLELRRRRRTSSAASRLSTSNSSIRSELISQGGRIRCGRIRSNQYLKPDITSAVKMGKSPPPSQSVLSGLSPTTVARWQHDSDTSSDSSL